MSLYPLPSLMRLEDYGGDWKAYESALYKKFTDSIVGKLRFLGQPIACRYFQPIGDRHRSFWHLITQNTEGSDLDEDRLPDFPRSERLPWIPHIIQNSHAPEIACWENKRGTSNNVVLWLPPEKYMVILSRRRDYYLLTSAYPHRDSKTRSNTREMEQCTDPRK